MKKGRLPRREPPLDRSLVGHELDIADSADDGADVHLSRRDLELARWRARTGHGHALPGPLAGRLAPTPHAGFRGDRADLALVVLLILTDPVLVPRPDPQVRQGVPGRCLKLHQGGEVPLLGLVGDHRFGVAVTRVTLV